MLRWSDRGRRHPPSEKIGLFDLKKSFPLSYGKFVDSSWFILNFFSHDLRNVEAKRLFPTWWLMATECSITIIAPSSTRSVNCHTNRDWIDIITLSNLLFNIIIFLFAYFIVILQNNVLTIKLWYFFIYIFNYHMWWYFLNLYALL